MDNELYSGYNAGVCPKCHIVDSLEYEESYAQDDSIKYPCKCKFCNFEGEEVYAVEFAGFEDGDGILYD